MAERDRSSATLAAFATSLVALAISAIVAVSPFVEARAPTAVQQAAGGTDIWKGVFTTAQADRGKAVFHAHCASCHDPSEQGEAPLLSGDVFMRNWEGHSVGRLYSKIIEEMPANNPESVASAQKLDVLTYILHENGFPSGATPLSGEPETLARIQIVPEGGLTGPRTGAMVVVVGCLGRAAPTEWRLTSRYGTGGHDSGTRVGRRERKRRQESGNTDRPPPARVSKSRFAAGAPHRGERLSRA